MHFGCQGRPGPQFWRVWGRAGLGFGGIWVPLAPLGWLLAALGGSCSLLATSQAPLGLLLNALK